MTAPLDEVYFDWLLQQVGAGASRNPARRYLSLAGQMFRTPFRWSVANDDNRAADGQDLREEFLGELRIPSVDNNWLTLASSLLEVLVSMARMASFESEKAPEEWFWIFLQNLNLLRYTDAVWNTQVADHVEEILDVFLDRRYGSDGTGGLFPLRYSHQDQRRVELWYQLAAYLLDSE